jgi:hypothetical protein
MKIREMAAEEPNQNGENNELDKKAKSGEEITGKKISEAS